MHELGIVMQVMDQVEKVAAENKVEKVTKLTLEVGEVSSVVPDLFRDCFEWAKKRTEHLKECALDLVVLEAITYCRACDSTYSTTEFGKKCPHCGSEDTYLVTGNEIKIKKVEILSNDA